MEGPLVEHVRFLHGYAVKDAVLGHDRKAERGGKAVNAVRDLGINMVGSAREDHHALAVCPRPFQRRIALSAHFGTIIRIGGKAAVHGAAHLGAADGRIEFLQHRQQRAHERPAGIDVQIGIEEVCLREVVHVGMEQFGIVGNDRAVVVVVPRLFVHIVGQAGIENRIDARCKQLLDMPVHDFCRVAGGVGRDRELPRLVGLARGEPGHDDLKAERGEERVPQRRKLIHPERKRQTELAAAPGDPGQSRKPFAFPRKEVRRVVGFADAEPALALVARDEALTVAEAVDRQAAMVLTAAADRRLRRVCKMLQRVGIQERALVKPHRIERRAVCAHHARDRGAHDIGAELVFKGAEHRVVEKRAALHHDGRTEIFGGIGADDLVNGVLDDADRQPCRNVGDRRAVLLRLLDRRVHEDRAARTEIDRRAALQPLAGEVLHAVAHRTGKGLNKGAAAGRACLVEHDGVDRAVFDLEALDVLPADIEDKIDVGAKMLCRRVMRQRLDQPRVGMERMPDEILAVAGDGTARNRDAVAAGTADGKQLLPHERDGVAAVGIIIGIENFLVFGDQHKLGRGTAAVNAEPCTPAVALDIPLSDRRRRMACAEGGERLLVREKRRQTVLRAAHFRGAVREALRQRVAVGRLAVRRVHCRAERNGIERIFGQNAGGLIEVQRLAEALDKPLTIVQRTAEKHDLARDAPPLCKPGNGLIDNCLIDACRDIRLGSALV